MVGRDLGKTYLLKALTTLLKAYSQAYILITRIPTTTSFMTRTRLSVILAALNLHICIIQNLSICGLTVPVISKKSGSKKLDENDENHKENSYKTTPTKFDVD